MRKISLIITAIDFLTMMIGAASLDSPGRGVYIAAGIFLAGILLALIGILVMAWAREKALKERRKRIERAIKRDSMFHHWCGCLLGNSVGDLDSTHGDHSASRRSQSIEKI